MTAKIQAFDSLFRRWEVWRDSDGMIHLDPIGHDTDPDDDGLSVEDELKLLALAPEMDGEGEDDHIGLMYDRARDRIEEQRMVA